MATRFDDIASGNNPNVKSLTKFGRNTNVSTTLADVWSAGGIWVGPVTAKIVSVVSTSALDTAAGTGCRTVQINGLDENYNELTETLTLNGLTPVNSTGTFFIVHRILGMTAGSLGWNAGTVSVTMIISGAPANMAQMRPEQGQSQFGIYQVPAGFTAYLTTYNVSFSSAVATALLDARLYAKPFGGMFNIKVNLSLAMAGNSTATRQYDAPLKFTEKTIIKMSAIATALSDVSGGFDLMLVKN